MSIAPSPQPAALLPTLSQTLEALIGAADDLRRAALILRQESQEPELRFRSPEDLRRIADQFSARALLCQQASEANLAVGRELAGAPPA